MFAIFMMTCGVTAPVHAADWSDTSLSFRTGQQFREPFNPQAISKNIFGLTHASGYQYGSNFFNVDFLHSDSKDPASLTQSSGAQEAYVVYRHTLDLGKISGKNMQFGAVRGVGITAGFDWNTKNDVGYNSRKRMLVLGPTLMWDVPGFLNTSLVLLQESNAPSGAFPPISNVKSRYHYKTHPMLTMSWGIPFSEHISFEGYANFIASKGVNEVGQQTGAETNIDMQLMWDVSHLIGSKVKTFKLGFEYQCWRNKFGNTAAITHGNGYHAKSPMVRAEYHF
ncbi:outer envelope protein [Undibacterium flavidum]|uniref:Outer envelope protein n=1 Tax=Undibacterium flavidum TaxID=2762297 RepID=A0ABR6YDM2_9BURK|nr:outer envelope protein [Undibacterium flavidum]MBC3874659.1 outer envelope protein [Undibacterium flavidum]